MGYIILTIIGDGYMKKQRLKIICLTMVMIVLAIRMGNLGLSKAVLLNATNIENVIANSKAYNALIYDADEKLIEEIQCDGNIIQYSYDSKDRISKISSNNGTVQNIKYDGNNVIIKVETKNGSYLYHVSEDNKTDITTLSMSKFETSSIRTASATYNMNQLITDKQFTNWKSMSQKKIQKFLKSKKSILAKPVKIYKKDKRGNLKLLKTVNTAKYIVKYCKKYKINPKVVICTLQKESALITTSELKSSSILTKAMGYGKTDSGTIKKYKRYDKQLIYGIKLFRTHYKKAPNQYPYCFRNVNYNRNSSDGMYKSYVWVKNRATYSLYKYTPHTLDANLYDKDGTKSGGNLLLLQVKKGFFKRW